MTRSSIATANDPARLSAAFGLDQSWVDDAKCRGRWEEFSPDENPWCADPRKNYTVGGQRVRGAELEKMALTTCAVCPAQWDCARHAVQAGELACAWAMHWEDMLWLQKQPGSAAIIDAAEARGQPVQFAVRRLRQE